MKTIKRNLLLFALFLFGLAAHSSAQNCTVNDKPIQLVNKEGIKKTYLAMTAIATRGSLNQGLDKKREYINIHIADFEAKTDQFGLEPISGRLMMIIQILGPSCAWEEELIKIKAGKITGYSSDDPYTTTVSIRFKSLENSIPLFRNYSQIEGELEIIELTENSICIKVNFDNKVTGEKIQFMNRFPLRPQGKF